MPGEIKHYWVGTTLMVESDAGVSGCDLKGQTGDIGPRGPQGPAGIVVDGGGSNVEVDGTTIIKNTDGTISTSIGGGVAECLATVSNLNKRNPTIGDGFGNSDLDIHFEIGASYSFYFTFSDGGTSAFVITIPSSSSYSAVITPNSDYFKSFTVFYEYGDDNKYSIALGMTVSYLDTVDTGITIKDIYITAGDSGMFMPITPYVIPIDGNTIQINSDGKLTALAGGSILPNYEVWTFTLEDSSTATKKVYVG